ncbi:MAG: pitrilysin family protein [Thermotogota bacterium]
MQNKVSESRKKRCLSDNLFSQRMDGVRSVCIGIAIKAGSSYEPAGKPGIAHFTEHMVFKGTKSRTAYELKEPIEKSGGTINAFTGKESTIYFARVPDYLARDAINILKSLCFEAEFPESQFHMEKQVVLEEIHSTEDDPVEQAYEGFFQEVWRECPYGKPILGNEKSINGLTREDLFDFYDSKYVCENMVFSLAGNYNPHLIDSLEGFRHGRKNRKEPEIIYSPRSALIIKEKEDLQQIHLLMGIEAPSRTDGDYEALQVLNTVLSGGMSSRLFHEIREKKGLVYAIDTGLVAYPLGGVFYLYSATTGEKIIPLLDELKRQLASLVEIGITEAELAYGKERLKGKLLLSTESTYATMMRNLDTGIAFGQPLSVDEMEKRIDGITAEGIRNALQKYFTSSWVVSMVIPAKSSEMIKKTELHMNGGFFL